MIDIIITNYNRETLITKAINSVFNQSYQDIHLIIVDDCSTDNSVKVIEDLLEHNTSKVKCTLVKNKINVGTGLKKVYTDAVRETIAKLHQTEYDPRKMVGPGRQAIANAIAEKCDLFNCTGKAPAVLKSIYG